MKTRILLELETDGLPDTKRACTTIENRVHDYLMAKGIVVKHCQATLMPTETPEVIGLAVRTNPPIQPPEDAV